MDYSWTASLIFQSFRLRTPNFSSASVFLSLYRFNDYHDWVIFISSKQNENVLFVHDVFADAVAEGYVTRLSCTACDLWSVPFTNTMGISKFPPPPHSLMWVFYWTLPHEHSTSQWRWTVFFPLRKKLNFISDFKENTRNWGMDHFCMTAVERVFQRCIYKRSLQKQISPFWMLNATEASSLVCLCSASLCTRDPSTSHYQTCLA